MHIAVVGSRGIPAIDFALVGAETGDVIVSGGAKGVDSLAEIAARAAGLAVEILKPDYKRFGRGAPHVRNRQIVDRCDRLVAFWDGKSRGTMETVDYARKSGKPVSVLAV